MRWIRAIVGPLVLAGCASAPPDTGTVKTPNSDRICVMPPFERVLHREALRQQEGLYVYCGPEEETDRLSIEWHEVLNEAERICALPEKERIDELWIVDARGWAIDCKTGDQFAVGPNIKHPLTPR